jgi:mannosylglucosylglycerate synthase
VVLVSFRLGQADGVSVESSKWAWALRELGHTVTTVAGAGRADVLVRGLEIDADEPPDRYELARAIGNHDLVIVENLCSLPLNVPALEAVASILEGRPAILHHHDLPWQRRHLAHLSGPPTDPAWRHVTINELSAAQLAQRGIEAVVVPNHFDFDPPAGDRPRMRQAIGVRERSLLVVHPVRAIPRKNVGAALRFAERLGAIYWILGDAEDGFEAELDGLLQFARTGVRQGMPEGFTIADVYAASDVVVLSSTWEGFGNPSLESVAYRTPLARYPYPVMAEIERRGLRFFDLDAIQALEKFVERPDHEMLDDNVTAARAHYDLQMLPERLARLVRSVLPTAAQ